MKRQIYLFTESGIAASYGVGAYITLLINLLKQENEFSIIIVELLSDNEEVVDVEISGIRYLYIPKAENGIKKSYYRNVFYILHHYIDKKQELIFHLNFMSCKNLAAMLKLYYPQAKVVLTIHYSVCGMAGCRVEEIEEDEKEIIGYCDTVIALSEHRYRFLIDNYHIPPVKIELVPHGFPDLYKEEFKKDLCMREQLGLKDEKIVLYVGRLDENKGVELLVKAFRIIEKNLHDVHLVIVGEGVLLPSLLQECRGLWGKVTFTGFLHKEEIYKLYANASIGVIPSLYEELGFVAIEMMMFGLPIVANESTGLFDIFKKSKAGKLVPLDNNNKSHAIESLADAVIKLLKDERLQKQYRMRARHHFDEKYAVEIFEERMLRIYKS